MRYSMFISFLVLATVIGNIIDLFSNTQDFTPNGPTIIVGTLLLIVLGVYMFKTPDRNFVPLRKVKKYLPEDVYKEISRKGPFQ